MTTPQRPIIGAEVAPAKPSPPQASDAPAPPAPDMLIARDLPPWDLLPADLLIVRVKGTK